MGKHLEEDDARTLRQFIEWLGDAEIADPEEAIAAFLRERAERREATYGK